MADAVVARWHGDNYQARVFWENALNLLLPNTCVAEVAFEAGGPKSFDDVVVNYDPPVAGAGPDRVSADYHQSSGTFRPAAGSGTRTSPVRISSGRNRSRCFSVLNKRDARRVCRRGLRFSRPIG